ncbi:MAG: cytochrome P450, partial [Spirulina sp. DLM2.Bin59]
MSLPPGPNTPPLLLLIRWILDPVTILREAFRKYGESFTLKLYRDAPFVLFTHPAAIEELFALGDEAVEVGAPNDILRPTLGDNSLLLLDGDRHKRQRQLLMPAFHGERMRTYGELIAQLTEREIKTWTVGQPLTLRPAMQRISLAVIIKTIFGIQESDRAQALQERTAALLSLTTSPLGFASAFFPILQRDWGRWSPGGNFLYLKQQVDELIYAEIAAGRANLDPHRTDVLSLMMTAVDDQGEGMGDEELRDELMTLLLAGHETTATALSWALYWIYQDADLLQRLRDELAPAPEDRP